MLCPVHNHPRVGQRLSGGLPTSAQAQGCAGTGTHWATATLPRTLLRGSTWGTGHGKGCDSGAAGQLPARAGTQHSKQDRSSGSSATGVSWIVQAEEEGKEVLPHGKSTQGSLWVPIQRAEGWEQMRPLQSEGISKNLAGINHQSAPGWHHLPPWHPFCN